MPVMNGYQFCMKTLQYFQDKNQIFDQNKDLVVNKPYLVACSAHIDYEIEENAKKAGFEFVVEQPLTQ